MRTLRGALHTLTWALAVLVMVSAALVALLGSGATSWASRHTALTAGGQHQQVTGYVPVPCLLWLLVVGACLLFPLIAVGGLHRPATGG